MTLSDELTSTSEEFRQYKLRAQAALKQNQVDTESQEKIKDLKLELVNSKQKIEELQDWVEQLKRYQSSTEELTKELVELEKKNAQLQQNISKLKEENLKKETESLKKEEAFMKEKQALMEKQSQKQKEEDAQTLLKFENLSKEIQLIKQQKMDQLDQLQKELNSTKLELQEVQQKLKEKELLLNSTPHFESKESTSPLPKNKYSPNHSSSQENLTIVKQTSLDQELLHFAQIQASRDQEISKARHEIEAVTQKKKMVLLY